MLQETLRKEKPGHGLGLGDEKDTLGRGKNWHKPKASPGSLTHWVHCVYQALCWSLEIRINKTQSHPQAGDRQVNKLLKGDVK